MLNLSKIFTQFAREQWAERRADEPMPLTAEDVERLQGEFEPVTVDEIESVYLPISRLLSYSVTAHQKRHQYIKTFLGNSQPKVPYLLGVTGSVSVGKSTTSRVLRALLSRWPSHPRVDLINTDGFIFPNAKLEALELMNRKGFPETVDEEGLLSFLRRVKAGEPRLNVPIYSHATYDIVPDEFIVVDQPDILIVEGLNVLQTFLAAENLFDYTVYVDADNDVIQQWYIQRVQLFCQTQFKDPTSYFHFLTELTQEELYQFAERVWHEINELNLVENILPYRERAQMILHKDNEHRVNTVSLRRG